MQFPLSWFKEVLKTKLSVDELAESLTQIGLEVEGIDTSCISGETVLEVALTPNLGHCASIFGMARELSALTQESLNQPQGNVVETSDKKSSELAHISVEEKELCPRYRCRVIEKVKVGPSPSWLQKRLEACGIRSVNNVVDITNYVLMELGHPLHAFDLDTLDNNKIVVRRAKKGETISTIDGKERPIDPNTLVIADANKPVALAGVMGSSDTEVSEKTETVLLEAAYFEPKQIRRTSKQQNVKTEASRRFERGSDPNGCVAALERASELIIKHCGGKVAQGVLEVIEGEFPQKRLSVRTPRANQILGTKLATGEIENLLQRLQFQIFSSQNEQVTVDIPTYRVDINHEIDLIEEVARMYGFDNLFHEMALTYREGELDHSPLYLFETKIRNQLIGQGLQELVTSNLISQNQAELMSADCMPLRSFIHILNPTSSDQSVLRPSLLPSFLQVAKKNKDHGIDTVHGFEVGRIHFDTQEKTEEPTVVSIMLSGTQAPFHFDAPSTPVDFFDLKGTLENLFSVLNLGKITFAPSHHQNFHPKQQAEIAVDGQGVGIMGQVHPNTLHKMDLCSPIYFAELNVSDLLNQKTQLKKYHPLPKFPSSSRDLTLTVKEECPLDTLLSTIAMTQEPLLEDVSLLDVYRSEKLGSGWKNITFRFIYRDQNQTVSFDAVEKSHREITAELVSQMEKSDWVKRG